MKLYVGTTSEFISDATQNHIADKLRNAFLDYYRYPPSSSEVDSWRNSLKAISLVFQRASLLEQGIILEYQLPQTSMRLDCLICGKDADQAIQPHRSLR